MYLSVTAGKINKLKLNRSKCSSQQPNLYHFCARFELNIREKLECETLFVEKIIFDIFLYYLVMAFYLYKAKLLLMPKNICHC